MSNQKKYTSVQEFLDDYYGSPDWYNLMVPVQSIQNFGFIYKPVINMVFLSTNLEDNEIYVQKNAKDPDGNSYRETRYSITKKGLMLIRSAADARFVDSVSKVDLEAKVVTYTVTMQFHNASGGWATITKSKTVSMIKKLRNNNTMDDPEAAQKAETGAQNRCIRDAFNIKGHYSLDDLKKPFVAFYLDLDETKDPDVKAAKIEAALGPTQLLYGAGRRMQQFQVSRQAALPESKVDHDTGEILDDGTSGNPSQDPPKLVCTFQDCGVEIAESVAKYSIDKFGQALCVKHQHAIKKGGRKE